jgi:DNA anti-recombination protein RmuC
MVALTHKTSVLKENKDPGKWGYLVAMQVIESSGLTRDYYQVVVEPRKGARK